MCTASCHGVGSTADCRLDGWFRVAVCVCCLALVVVSASTSGAASSGQLGHLGAGFGACGVGASSRALGWHGLGVGGSRALSAGLRARSPDGHAPTRRLGASSAPSSASASVLGVGSASSVGSCALSSGLALAANGAGSACLGGLGMAAHDGLGAAASASSAPCRACSASTAATAPSARSPSCSMRWLLCCVVCFLAAGLLVLGGLGSCALAVASSAE